MAADMACMEHVLLVIWSFVWQLAGLCARVAVALWLAGLLTGVTALIARIIVGAWLRRPVRPPDTATIMPACAQGVPD